MMHSNYAQKKEKIEGLEHFKFKKISNQYNISEAFAVEMTKVMEKVFNILKRELSIEEYLIYLQIITSRIGDATAELRDMTKKMNLEEVLRRAKMIEKS